MEARYAIARASAASSGFGIFLREKIKERAF
jgi:hypothetical protein